MADNKSSVVKQDKKAYSILFDPRFYLCATIPFHAYLVIAKGELNDEMKVRISKEYVSFITIFQFQSWYATMMEAEKQTDDLSDFNNWNAKDVKAVLDKLSSENNNEERASIA